MRATSPSNLSLILKGFLSVDFATGLRQSPPNILILIPQTLHKFCRDEVLRTRIVLKGSPKALPKSRYPILQSRTQRVGTRQLQRRYSTLPPMAINFTRKKTMMNAKYFAALTTIILSTALSQPVTQAHTFLLSSNRQINSARPRPPVDGAPGGRTPAGSRVAPPVLEHEVPP